jgi:hypothetical protein
LLVVLSLAVLCMSVVCMCVHHLVECDSISHVNITVTFVSGTAAALPA